MESAPRPSLIRPPARESRDPVKPPDPDVEIKRMEFLVEVVRLAILAGVAVAFAHVGQMELASAAMGGALALLRPRGAPGPGALTVGLAFGAATSLALSSGVVI